MSAGKAMAQAAHAVSLVSTAKDIKLYNKAQRRTVIVLEGSATQIENLALYLFERGFRSQYVIDEGVNEIETMQITALATQQFDIENIDWRDMFRGFKLYKHGMFQR